MAKKRKNKRMRKRLWFTATERVEARQRRHGVEECFDCADETDGLRAA